MSDPIKLTYQGQATVLQQGTIGVLNTTFVNNGYNPYNPSYQCHPVYPPGQIIIPQAQYTPTELRNLPLDILNIIKINLEVILPKVRMTKLQDLPGKKMGLDFGIEIQSPGEAVMNLLEIINTQIEIYGNDTQREGPIPGNKE